MELHGEFRKIKCLIFDGKSKEGAKALLVKINKYFKVYDYENNLKACLKIYQLQGKVAL